MRSEARRHEAPPRLDWHDVGRVLFVFAVLGLVSVGVALGAGEGTAALAFGTAAGLAALFGAALRRFGPSGVRRREGAVMASMALAWLVVPAIGGLPFLWLSWTGVAGAECYDTPLDALFEAMSGFTSCGLTLSPDASELPASLQWWRSASQWVGGVGVAALLLAFREPGGDVQPLFRSEVGAPFARDVRRSARWAWTIYVSLTVVAIATFWLLGMPAWEALNHGLCASATGGFTVTADSFQSYAPRLQAAAAVLMLLGALSFDSFYRLVRGRRLGWIRTSAIAALLGGVLLAGVLAHGLVDDASGWRGALFTAASAFATGGFGAVDLSAWPAGALAVVMTAMLIGGEGGSTAGGIKIDRLQLVLRAVGWKVRRALVTGDRPTMRVVHRRKLEEHEARRRTESAALLIVTWLGTLAVGTLGLAAFVEEGTRFQTIAFEAVSALSGVGLSAGVTTDALHPGGKAVLVALMWVGRLELFAALYLVSLLPLGGRASEPEGLERDAAEEEEHDDSA